MPQLQEAPRLDDTVVYVLLKATTKQTRLPPFGNEEVRLGTTNNKSSYEKHTTVNQDGGSGCNLDDRQFGLRTAGQSDIAGL